jgi:hypothetical protein
LGATTYKPYRQGQHRKSTSGDGQPGQEHRLDSLSPSGNGRRRKNYVVARHLCRFFEFYRGMILFRNRSVNNSATLKQLSKA